MNPVLDIELLRTFQAVAQLGQFRAAAEHVHRSPAAVSMHIQRLEAVAGGRLLERDNQSVTLTPLGKRLLAGTADLLRRHDKVLEDLRGTDLTGRIKLGVPDEYAVHVIRDVLPLFAAAWPNVVLDVSTAPSLTLRAQVERGRLHLALAVRPARAGPAAQVLARTTPVWVGSATRTGDLPRPLPLALHATHCPYRDAMTGALDQAGRAWRIVLSSPSSRAVEACVEAGLGISLVDRSRITAGMRVLEALPAIAAHEIVLLRAASALEDPAANQLDSILRKHFRA
ncbi:LysR substrate-binding domain-containing protein [Achromobacter insuavis]|uniref:LysR substrate-binding domain-containing protein n=1 Tax=Achromobacter insuavis TaxID=1287735 RepID=UPI001F13B2E0|nr:LysR substrate-binding domain-containing protein [Achromobacter insuavis]